MASSSWPIHTLQNQLPARIVVYLAGNRVEMEAGLEAANRSEIHRKKIEKERALRFSREGDELAAGVRLHAAVDVLEIRCLAAESRTVIHDLAGDLAGGIVDHRHCKFLRY